MKQEVAALYTYAPPPSQLSNHSKNPKASPMTFTSSYETFGLFAIGTPDEAKYERESVAGWDFIGGEVVTVTPHLLSALVLSPVNT